ncbi:hypothetical protein BJ165DRAFT_1131447 [Panaeolus papilionaceus]|nr:hypothetical protein BJ165DRAFT_1131447 [Panaeolus papilionaceus]
MSSYSNYNRGYSSRRRASPTYDDYQESSSQSSTRCPPSPTYNSISNDRHPNNSYSTYSEDRISSNYNSNSYSNYRRLWRPLDDVQSTQHRNGNYQGRRSPPPPPSSSLKLQQFPTSSQSTYHRRRTPSPEVPTPQPVARTEPTPEYLLTAEIPSKQIADPTSSRKLLVLDLNGSLLVRSAHRKPATLPRNAPYDPYAEPTRPRALRSVHPRPYMRAFREYLFHEETKKWLDTMVWSSAQPHSVADMVDKAFEERKDELKAVWARDTLGLSANQYHQKTQTTKDLAKPWAEISALRHSAELSSTDGEPSTVAHPSGQGSTAEDESRSDVDITSQSHSAHTTLLMDDSPLKAILQPFNHLCISEYTSDMRRKDLATLEIQNLKKRKVQETQPLDQPNEETHEAERVQHKVVEKVAERGLEEDEYSVTVSFEDLSRLSKERAKEERAIEWERKQKKKDRKKRAKERKRQEKEEELLAQLETMSGEEPASSSSIETSALGLVDDASFDYDSTLLAAIGILEHVKHEDNIAAWMKSEGLVRVPGLEGVQVEDIKPETDNTDASASSQTAPEVEEKVIPVVDIAIAMDVDKPDTLNTTKSASGIAHTPPSHDTTPVPTKKRRISDELEQSPLEPSNSTEVPAVQATEDELQITTSVARTELDQVAPASERDQVSQKQWFENSSILAFWATKGRAALLKLGIPVQSGVTG